MLGLAARGARRRQAVPRRRPALPGQPLLARPGAPQPPPPRRPHLARHVALKAVARDKRRRFETAEEFLLALERGASRPLTAPPATPLMQRDPTVLWKLLLVVWLLFLPR